ncbi:hypothetical protein P0082_03085 [Candidatus Haliotispira prima]|uniref:Outer membrane protein beta-barrel domain-containing protein n=1 Tax=Candidatus Haliotispira prima TaxID=3034016 RepID=A0ABY8MIP8_9SPIO|nr:hypothetical protein P0082_03085 [Candidatus Haliotispira prima]
MFCRIFPELRAVGCAKLQRMAALLFVVLLCCSVLPVLGAQGTPRAPSPPSRSRNNPEGAPAEREAGRPDPSFPKLELEDAPLRSPDTGRGGGVGRSDLLYRQFVFEAFSGYYGSVLSLYNTDESKGNSNGNTRESDWNNLYNIIVGAQVSGNVRNVHYKVWFGMPFNLGMDYVQLRNYEFADSSLTGRFNDDVSYRGTFSGKASYLLMGGLQIGASIVDRKSAKLIFGAGAEGFLGQWEIFGGKDHKNLLVNIDPNSSEEYASGTKTLSLSSGQVMPFLYLQGGAFLSPIVEVSIGVGYSPLTIWFAEENRIYEVNPTQYRRYGYFGQTILGEFQARIWFARRFTLNLGVKGRYTFKTTGNLRTYDIDSTGKPVDEQAFVLLTNAGAMEHFQISAFFGIGLAFDGKLPPGKDYKMPF